MTSSYMALEIIIALHFFLRIIKHWSRLLRVPWTARRSNQSILKEINSDYSLEILMLKLQYFGHLMWTVDSLEKTLMLGKIEGRRRRGQQRMRWLDVHHLLDGHEFESAPGGGDGQEILACCSPWGCRVRHDWATELNWNTHRNILSRDHI